MPDKRRHWVLFSATSSLSLVADVRWVGFPDHSGSGCSEAGMECVQPLEEKWSVGFSVVGKIIPRRF